MYIFGWNLFLNQYKQIQHGGTFKILHYSYGRLFHIS